VHLVADVSEVLEHALQKETAATTVAA